MTKHTEIPADILKAAQAICAEFDPSDTAICVAIMGERERCAKIVDSWPTSLRACRMAALIRSDTL